MRGVFLAVLLVLALPPSAACPAAAGTLEVRRVADPGEVARLQRLDDIRPRYSFTESCYGTVPSVIIAFLEAESHEETIRNAISLGGDADTLVCIAGAIGEAYFGGVPRKIADKAMAKLDDRLRGVVESFYQRFVR